jgi:hypothetical protein
MNGEPEILRQVTTIRFGHLIFTFVTQASGRGTPMSVFFGAGPDGQGEISRYKRGPVRD